MQPLFDEEDLSRLERVLLRGVGFSAEQGVNLLWQIRTYRDRWLKAERELYIARQRVESLEGDVNELQLSVLLGGEQDARQETY